jgi:hypothetical protein
MVLSFGRVNTRAAHAICSGQTCQLFSECYPVRIEFALDSAAMAQSLGRDDLFVPGKKKPIERQLGELRYSLRRN